MLKIAAIIPARYASTRFPGKPLAMLGDKTMIERVYQRVASVLEISRVIVATDDQRIFDHVLSFGGEVMMTSPTHPSGTDRVAEVAIGLVDVDIIINVQGDEPFVDPLQLMELIAPFEREEVSITTLAHRISNEADLFSPNVVKVVADNRQRALYFSRQAIPYLRDVPLGQWLNARCHYQHLGLYAYRRATLLELTKLQQNELETNESLEQLRWLAAGFDVHLGYTDIRTIGIDTPQDLERAIAELPTEHLG